MTLATAHGVVLDGVRGVVVRVEVAVSDGLPSVGVVGLPDASVTEARWRARCAVEASGRSWPNRRVTVSLSPAEVRKHGAGLDLPIAVGILVAASALPAGSLESTIFVGELGLDGRLRPSRGLLAAILAARRAGFTRVVVPDEGACEADVVPGITVVRAVDLSQVCRILEGVDPGCGAVRSEVRTDGRGSGERDGGEGGHAHAVSEIGDLSDVRGHALPRWALEVAAAGGHHLAMVGPPGIGKTLLASRLPGLLPDLSDDSALDVAAIHSVAGRRRPPDAFTEPPLSAPHHSASAPAILGSVSGGRAVPGAVTLAHRGVLFLDEAPEFCRPALEGLRQPLESGLLTLHRTGWNGTLPARFQLVIAANPCPCGQRTGSGTGCSCAPAAVRRYASRLSGPLLDRVDIRLAVDRPHPAELESTDLPESSAVVQDRVRSARARMAHRYEGLPWQLTSEVPTGDLRRRWPPGPDGAEVLRDFERRSPNLRGVDRVLRMAWTLADLRAAPAPGRDDVAGALALRGAHLGWS
jgi:magnesium chelatase family protein